MLATRPLSGGRRASKIGSDRLSLASAALSPFFDQVLFCLPQSTPTNEALVAKLEHLRRPVKPLPFFTNRHVETIAAALFRRKLGFTYRRELLPTPDGGVVALDWPWEQVRALEAGMVSDDAPLVILFPGESWLGARWHLGGEQ